MTLRVLAKLLACLALPVLLAPAPAAAQDSPPSSEAAKQAETPKTSDTPKGGEKTKAGETKAGETTKAEEPQDFPSLFAKFHDIEEQMADTARLYRAAAAAERRNLLGDYRRLIAQSNQMLPQLKRAAVVEYKKAPNKDQNVTRTLVGVLANHVRNDEYEEAFELGQMLEENKCSVEAFRCYLGIAAVCLNETELAETQLKLAEAAGALEGKGPEYLQQIDEMKEKWAAEQKIREKETADDDLPRVKIKTNRGDIVVELYENQAPQTVGNFISLVESGFYNERPFHRVLGGFMAQGGCPKGDGTGGPGYKIFCECEREDYRRHFRGTLSMAHAGKNTGGSQFFLTFVPTSHLDGKHTAFGRVIEGFDVLAKLQRRDPTKAGQPDPDRIDKAEVLRKRDHEYKPTKVDGN